MSGVDRFRRLDKARRPAKVVAMYSTWEAFFRIHPIAES